MTTYHWCWCGTPVNYTGGLEAVEKHLQSDKHRKEVLIRCLYCGSRDNWHAPRCHVVRSEVWES